MTIFRKFRKPRFLFVYPLAVICFLMAHPTRLAFQLGIPVMGLGEAIRLWANGYVGHRKVNKAQGPLKIGHLITGGPYAFVRHPLYLGSLLIGAGFCLVVGHWGLGLAALAGFILIYRPKIAEEEATLRREWPEAFEHYASAVPRWLPDGRRYAHPYGAWSWRGLVASKEWKTVMGIGALLILFYFREVLIRQREPWGGEHQARHLWFAGLLVCLLLSDRLLERWRNGKLGSSGVMHTPSGTG